MPLDGTPYATPNANQQGQQKRRAAANVPAPPSPVQPAPYQTPTYGDVLKDARAGVQEPGSQYGLDRMTGQPFSVGRMQQQGIGEANRFVDRSIYRRAMTDPRSLYPENRTGIAPINLMAENDRRLDLDAARQAMAESGAARRERLTADAIRQGEESGNYNQILRGNMALDRAYYMNKYGTPRSPGQMNAWAERADARQRMLDRKAAFERAKYGRIALDRYGILPDMATANLYAMTNQPVETMTAMGELNAADAASEQAKAQMEYQKGMFEQQARQAEMDSLTTLITTPGIDQQTQRKAQKRLFELSSGLTGQGATQAGPPGQAGPSEAVKALTPMQAANMNPQERQDVIDTARYDEGLKQYFPDMKDPQSIAWTMGEKLRYGVVPPEDVLQKLSNYVSAMGAVDTTFRAGSQRKLLTLFGLTGGDWRVYDDIINAPPGKKREAAIRTLRDVYGSGSVALLPQEDQQILAGIQAPPAAPPQASPATPAPAAPPRPASPQAPTAPQATAPPAAPQRPMTPDEDAEARMADQQQQGEVDDIEPGVRTAPKTPLQQAREATQASLPQRPAEPQRQPQPNVAVPFFAGPSMMPPQGPAPPSVVQQVREAIGLSGPPANVPVRAPDRYATNSPELSPMNITSPQVNAPEAGLPPAPQRTVSPDFGVPPGPVRTVGSVAAPSEGAPPNPAIPVASPQAGIAPVPQSATPQAFANLSPENMLMLQQAVERQLAAQRQLEAMRLREMLKSMTPEQAARQMEYMPRGMAMPGQVPMAPEQFNAPITPTPSPTMLQNLLRAEQPWISTEPMTRTIPRAMGRAYGNLQQGMRSLDERINRFLMP